MTTMMIKIWMLLQRPQSRDCDREQKLEDHDNSSRPEQYPQYMNTQ